MSAQILHHRVASHGWPTVLSDWASTAAAKDSIINVLYEGPVAQAYEPAISPRSNASSVVLLDDVKLQTDLPAFTRPLREFQRGPLCKLSARLLDTYNTINERYYAKQAEARSELDDKDGAYVVVPGELIQNRYCVVNKIGSGAFGVVVAAFDQHRREWVAIKIINKKPLFLKQARVERSLLAQLKSLDPTDAFHIVRMRDSFEHRGHPCMIFELLSRNLFDVLRSANFVGLSLRLVRIISHQMMHTLAFLSRPEINVIHADIKLENILLKREDASDFKLVDFGAACKAPEQIYTYIQSRFYRAPEVILGLRYSCAIDVWSLACCMVELLTGNPLFPGHNEADQMGKIIEVCGWPSPFLLHSSPKRGKLFQLTSSSPVLLNQMHPQPVAGSRPLDRVLRHVRSRLQQSGGGLEQLSSFQDLVSRMLVIDPSHRMKPLHALQHPFFNLH